MSAQATLPGTVTPLEHLRACAGKDETRWLSKPFTVEWEGSVWSCATDGHALLMLKGVVPGVEPLVAKDGATIDFLLRDIANRPRRGTSADWKAVAGFLSHGLPGTPPPCTVCNGKKTPVVECERCDGEGEIECCECGNERNCPDCDGVGSTGGCTGCDEIAAPQEKPDTGRFFGLLVDRRILRRVLGPLSIDQLLIGIGGALDPILLEDSSATWFAVVMPMRAPSSSPESRPVIQ